jgi:sporulation-control protein
VVFKRMLQGLGVGGPSVDTVLSFARVRPGDLLSGEVRIRGGDHGVNIDHVALGLVTRVEVEYGDQEHSSRVEFFRTMVSGPFGLGAGQHWAIPFQLPIPYETPITEIHGQPMHGMTLGVRTELAVAKEVDKSDSDPLAVCPLPSQELILRALGELGFRFRGADLEQGRLRGVRQELPFYQEIEFSPPPQYAGRVSEVELTFVADPGGLQVVLEADKRGGTLGSGHDSFGHFHLTHDQALRTNWVGEISRWLEEASRRRAHQPHHSHGPHPHGPEHGYRHHKHPGGHGKGKAAAAGIAGVVGGFLAAEVADEIGDLFEGDD